MHPAVQDWVQTSYAEWCANGARSAHSVLEFGSLDINGSIRGLFTDVASYIGVDLQTGPGVDVVADAHTFATDQRFDVVAACEVFEHTAVWREVIANAETLLKPGGLFVATMAGPGRAPHSAIDEQPIRDFEHYANIEPTELGSCLAELFDRHVVDQSGSDVRCHAVKRKATP